MGYQIHEQQGEGEIFTPVDAGVGGETQWSTSIQCLLSPCLFPPVLKLNETIVWLGNALKPVWDWGEPGLKVWRRLPTWLTLSCFHLSPVCSSLIKAIHPLLLQHWMFPIQCFQIFPQDVHLFNNETLNGMKPCWSICVASVSNMRCKKVENPKTQRIWVVKSLVLSASAVISTFPTSNNSNEQEWWQPWPWAWEWMSTWSNRGILWWQIKIKIFLVFS